MSKRPMPSWQERAAQAGTASAKAATGDVNLLQSARFVTVKLAVLLTGLTDRAIRSKMSDGTWMEGREFRRRGSAVFVDMQGYEKWVDKG